MKTRRAPSTARPTSRHTQFHVPFYAGNRTELRSGTDAPHRTARRKLLSCPCQGLACSLRSGHFRGGRSCCIALPDCTFSAEAAALEGLGQGQGRSIMTSRTADKVNRRQLVGGHELKGISRPPLSSSNKKRDKNFCCAQGYTNFMTNPIFKQKARETVASSAAISNFDEECSACVNLKKERDLTSKGWELQSMVTKYLETRITKLEAENIKLQAKNSKLEDENEYLREKAELLPTEREQDLDPLERKPIILPAFDKENKLPRVHARTR